MQSAVTLEEVQALFERDLPFCREMNISPEHVDVDLGVTRFRYEERWTRPGGYINGGTLMTLADVAVFVAIFSRTGIIPLAVTNELKMNFLRPAVGRDVLAEARLHKPGKRVAFASVEVYMEGDRDRLVAHATCSYVLPDGPR
ncbi:MAG: PaaI family thioesterase [Acidimicrobiia bacterium]